MDRDWASSKFVEAGDQVALWYMATRLSCSHKACIIEVGQGSFGRRPEAKRHPGKSGDKIRAR